MWSEEDHPRNADGTFAGGEKAASLARKANEHLAALKRARPGDKRAWFVADTASRLFNQASEEAQTYGMQNRGSRDLSDRAARTYRALGSAARNRSVALARAAGWTK